MDAQSGEFDSVEAFWSWMREFIGFDLWKESGEISDWTLVVKCHAMIETALNEALVRHFSEPDLGPIISKLETSNSRTGKVAFVKALKILEPEQTVFIQKLSEARNFCVHDIRNFDFTIEKYIQHLGESEGAAFLKAVKKGIYGGVDFDAPQKELFFATICVMATCFGHTLRCDLRDGKSEANRLMSELFLLRNRSKPKESLDTQSPSPPA